MDTPLEKTKILDISITISSKEKILEYIIMRLKNKDKKVFVTTPNPEMLVLAHHDSRFKTILNSADISLPDGIGLLWASRLLAAGIKERITGVDFMDLIIQHIAENAVTVGFLGGRKNVAENVVKCLKKKHPKLQVAFAASEWEDIEPEKRNADILFVAFGFPKQEIWIYDHLDKIRIQVAMGVGGAFDYLAGEVARAPRFVRSLGLEWLYRLIRQPWRWKRQLALPQFVWLVMKESITKK